MRYGSLEFAYAEPFANALIADPAFREWVLGRTRFVAHAPGAMLLSEEMMAHRAAGSKTWWRSHFTEKCRCQGCRGQETDILAIFKSIEGLQLALHFEVKQPTDRFPLHKDQARGYALRAECWAKSPPQAVLPHQDADTVLLCAASKLEEYAPHIASFGSFITFEELAEHFPRATIASASMPTPSARPI